MLLEELKELRTRPIDLRRFGLTVGAVFALVGIWCWARHKPAYPWFLTPGLLLISLGAVWPGSLRLIHRVWMSLAIVLGFLVSNLLLSLLFFLVITPIALAARLAGKDFLRRKPLADDASCWIARDGSARPDSDYEKQF
jgi:hypothetical protein